MKWWYLLVLVLGMGLGFWYLNYGTINKVAKTGEKAVSTPQVLTDKKGEKMEMLRVSGITLNWDYENGIIEIQVDKEKLKYKIDVNEAVITVPDKKNKENILMINSMKNNIYFDRYWKTAFCKDDLVTLMVSGEVVKYIDNGGYRLCGFRE